MAICYGTGGDKGKLASQVEECEAAQGADQVVGGSRVEIKQRI